MCGIAGIINKGDTSLDLSGKILAMSKAIQHRGPDGEGFMIATSETSVPYFSQLQRNYLHTELPYIPKHSITESDSTPKPRLIEQR